MKRGRFFRFALVAALCLLLGAVVSLAIAAGTCVLQVDSSVGHDWFPSDSPSDRCMAGETRWMTFCYVFDVDPPAGGTPQPVPACIKENWKLRGVDRKIWAFGLPYRCLSGSVVFASPSLFDGFIDLGGGTKAVVVMRTPELEGARLVPTRIYGPGFAVDTGVYAAAWWVVIFAPIPLYRAGRRRVRVSRGMCGSCGYDLKGSNGPVCPECGA